MNKNTTTTNAKAATQADTMTPAVRFFYEHAGFSKTPEQSYEEGKTETAQRLAEAEATAKARGYVFRWAQDDTTNREWTDEGEEYFTQRCGCYKSISETSLECLANLSGIDMGPSGVDDAYRRVVEAELALEAIEADPEEEEGGSHSSDAYDEEEIREEVGKAVVRLRAIAVGIDGTSTEESIREVIRMLEFAIS